ncbi:hypothetical protein B0T16DRAFT_442398 [Cercophora newfieldiana]|uniref:Uncharacterized protein n=1 Tax=Cercophora newfieldiana TaxID=92897 RepID=A0AA39YSF8_9PEZI|nr:hypothetical protein B0T16DRAFT_442398 [Cercophora newfieldiana]
MAAPDIALFGIAFDRDVFVHEDASELHSSYPDLLSGGLDSLPITCYPLFSPALPAHSAPQSLSPISLSKDQLAKDCLAHPGATPTGNLGGKSAFLLFEDDEDDYLGVCLNRFSKTFERHEQIALALASTNPRIEVPYEDYLPCPGSGPGSPAVSVATNYIPPAAPIVVETPRPEQQPQVRLADVVNAHSPASTGGPMTRYLSDVSQGHEWLAVVMQRPSSNAVTTNTRETGPDHHDSPTSSITLDGEHAAECLHLAAPALGSTSSTTRKFEDEEDGEHSAHTFQTLSTLGLDIGGNKGSLMVDLASFEMNAGITVIQGLILGQQAEATREPTSALKDGRMEFQQVPLSLSLVDICFASKGAWQPAEICEVSGFYRKPKHLLEYQPTQ